MKKIIVLSLVLVLGVAQQGFSAVGCTLNDPDRDILRLFPESTGYKTEFYTIQEEGGEALGQQIEERLGDKFDTVYETLDVPYAYYTILDKKEVIGYVHGVNQKGTYGGMQLILATNVEGEVIDFYYQRISSPEAKRFKKNEFRDQFVGLKLETFKETVTTIQDPSEESKEDFQNTLRGFKKNLLLLDVFKLQRVGVNKDEK